MTQLKRFQVSEGSFCHFLTLSCLFFIHTFIFAFYAPAQSVSPLTELSSLESKLAKARNFVVSYNNDSAKSLLQPLIPLLKEEGKLDSHIGLHIQVTLAKAMEHDDQDSLATEALLQIKEKSRAKAYWDVYTTACLVLANLHETMGQPEESKTNIEEARFAMAQQPIDTIYPFFAIRLASWNRIYGNKDSAVFYAEEALKAATTYDQPLEVAVSYLLLGLLARDDYEKAISYFKQGANICGSIKDYVGESFNFGNITRLYTRNNRLNLALTYNDSTIIAAQNAIEQGFERHRTIFNAYKLRAEIYERMGRLDSVAFYLRKGYEMEIENIQASEHLKAMEIDAKYADEKKAQQITAQAQQLKTEQERRQLIVLLAFSILIFAIILVYYYLKLRNINQKNKAQAVQLAQLDEVKSRFFANVSHELRTPLSLMTGPINSLLKENKLTERQIILLQMANRSGKQLSQLINEILDLRKLELGKLKLQPEPIALFDFFLKYAAQFESLAMYKQIDYQYDIDIESGIFAAIDREKSRQILYNLLSNAFKYTPKNGQISLKTYIVDSALWIVVADNGPGIHAEDLPYIFDRYFQTNRPEKSAEGGTGIGLALCKEYVTLFGGSIQVESQLGKGATFKLSFPLTLVPKSASDIHQEYLLSDIPPPTNNQSRTPLLSINPSTNGQVSKPKVLLVEDNLDLQAYIRMVLSTSYEVLAADHGQDAWEMLKKTSDIQLIISDLMMPVMDGYQLLERLKSTDETRHIPAIMLTARAELSDKLKALRIGVDDYMLKPFNEEELLVRVENLLQNQAVRQAIILEEHASEEGDSRPIMSAPDREWLTSFEHYVKANLSSDLLSVPYLSDEFAMSKSTLLRQLKRLTGLSPNQYLTEVRLDEARRLLENRSLDSISAVAHKVGYKDIRSFSRSFKKRFQKLPSEV